MTMVITPEIPRAKDAQDVGFRWVSFTRASPPKVGQFWMRANIPCHATTQGDRKRKHSTGESQ
ncbi:hypothetical protein [Stenotrophomonas maltophilia]|uniref:hypothetical protein n=1 Tax=Stenotrophomonas maltophilia TaxID=40324 RepID=UPI0019551660|nr:hypothetical protein [Stenotrophomonas maltophilia]